jgi:thiol-disulfide isomerase/thioredoxin
MPIRHQVVIMRTDDRSTMRTNQPAIRFAALLAVLLSLAACGGSVTTPKPTALQPGTSAPPGGVAVAPAWATTALVDVATGESFQIADLAGKVVIVETMAIWCTNCRSQQHSVEGALARLPADRVVYVILDVDPNEDAASLAAYRTQQGFTGRYVIAPAAVARALADDFSDQFLSPPSTPIAVVGADGTVTRTDFGQKSSDDIVALALAAGA